MDQYRGSSWRGLEAKEVELANEEALSMAEELQRSFKEGEREVEVLALTEAPDIDLNVVVAKEPSTSEVKEEEDSRGKPGGK